MVGRLILKIMPWWVFAIIAICFVPLSAKMIGDTIAERAETALAQRLSAPAPQPIATFSRARVTTPLDEVYLMGRLLTDVGPWERAQKGVNFSYLVITQAPPSSTAAPRYVLLYFESYQTTSTLAQLAAQTDADGTVRVRGFVTDRPVGLPPKAWLDQAVPNGALQAVVLPYFGPRSAAIAKVESDSVFVAVLGAVFNLIFAAIAFFKFQAWRKRSAAKRTGSAAAQQPSRPLEAKPEKPVPKRARKSDDFADGPIQSAKKGWF